MNKGFNPFGSWEDFQLTLNRSGFAWKNLLGQDRGPIDLTRSGGLLFPPTQIDSSNPNVLDDYEEGTWLPSLKFGGGTTGITYSTRGGTYTKVGRVCTIQMFIGLSSKGSSTGTAVIADAPFPTPLGGASSTAPVYWVLMTSSLANFVAIFAANSINIVLYGVTAGATSLAALTDADFADNSIIEFSMSYFTTV